MSEEELLNQVREANTRDEIKGEMRNSSVNIDQRKSYHLKQYATLNKLTADEILEIGITAGFTVKKETRSKVSLEPPMTLIEQYGLDNLLTNETRVLFKKINTYSAESLALKAKQLVRRIGKSFRPH